MGNEVKKELVVKIDGKEVVCWSVKKCGWEGDFSEVYIGRLVKDGKLESVKVDGVRYVVKESFVGWMGKKGKGNKDKINWIVKLDEKGVEMLEEMGYEVIRQSVYMKGGWGGKEE